MNEERRKIFEEIGKIYEQYKILLEREKAGESIKDLIKQNKKYRKVLAKKSYKMSRERGIGFDRDRVMKLMEEDQTNLNWLKHQYYDLGRSIQDIANELGVSMIRIRKSLDRIESISEEKEAESITDVPPSKILVKRAYTMSEKRGKEFDRDREIKLMEEVISMFERGVKVLEEIMKNDEEYKILLERKKAGESVENLIKQNRNYADLLAKKDRERIKESKKWRQSEEAIKVVEMVEETRRMNPDLARDSDIRLERGLKITNEIKKNEEEYEKLLERKNKGEYVDDLIKQNLYTAKVLAEQNKKVWEEQLLSSSPKSEVSQLKTKELQPIPSFSDRDRKIKEMEDMLPKMPEGSQKNKTIELKDKFQLETKVNAMLKKGTKNFEEIVKNDEEYKILLARKKAGEPVEDLINQNRYQAKILAKKDKENIEEIYEITSKIGNEFKKNEEEYEKLLERKNKGEYVDDLIKQNRYTAEVLTEQNKKVWDESHYQGLTMKLEVKHAEMQRKHQTSNQMLNILEKRTKNIQDFMKNEMEYKNLSKQEKLGEDVEDLIKQNRIYVEDLRRDYIKSHFEAKELLRMNPDLFQDPIEKHFLFKAFGLSHEENKKQIREENKKKKSQKCPNCRIMMNYLEDLDGYQCPKCKKKFYLWEKKLTIMGHI